jgi:hypothetical protein
MFILAENFVDELHLLTLDVLLKVVLCFSMCKYPQRACFCCFASEELFYDNK